MDVAASTETLKWKIPASIFQSQGMTAGKSELGWNGMQMELSLSPQDEPYYSIRRSLALKL